MYRIWGISCTLSKPSSMATLANSLACPDCFSVFIPRQIIKEKAVWPCKSEKTTPHWPHRSCCRLVDFYYMSYLVVHHHWINPRNILCEIHLLFHFRMHIYLLFFSVVLPCSMVHASFPHFRMFLLAVTSFGSLALSVINMDDTISF